MTLVFILKLSVQVIKLHPKFYDVEFFVLFCFFWGGEERIEKGFYN